MRTFCVVFSIADSFYSWWNHVPMAVIPGTAKYSQNVQQQKFCTTNIFCNSYVFFVKNSDVLLEWEMELTRMWRPAYAVFFIVCLLPGILYGMLKHSGSQMPMMPIVSLQGYGLLPFIPAAIFCILPVLF